MRNSYRIYLSINIVRRFKIDISGNKMLLRSDNQGHKETFLCEEYTQPLNISRRSLVCVFSRDFMDTEISCSDAAN